MHRAVSLEHGRAPNLQPCIGTIRMLGEKFSPERRICGMQFLGSIWFSDDRTIINISPKLRWYLSLGGLCAFYGAYPYPSDRLPLAIF